MRQAVMLRIDNADLMNAKIQIIGEQWTNTIVNARKLGSPCPFPLSVKQKDDLLTCFILMDLSVPDLPQELVVLVHVSQHW